MTTARVNLRTNDITQYGAYPFISFCKFNDHPIGAGPDGIFTLDGNGDDIYTEVTDERDINAWFELPNSQLGLENLKQGRRLYIGGEFNGSMSVKVEATGGTIASNTYDITPRNINNLQHTVQIPLNSRQKGEYWGFTFSNVLGADFSLDFIDGVFVNVVRRLGL